MWLHYRSAVLASKAVKRFERKLDGRRVRTKIQPPPKHHKKPESIWSVQLSNVSIVTTKEQLQQRLGGVAPDKIILGQPTADKTGEEAIEFIKGLLTQSERKLQSFEVEVNATGSRTIAYARFERASDVEPAVLLTGTEFPGLGSKLFVEPAAAVTVLVLRNLYSILESKIQKLQSNNKEGVRVSARELSKCKVMTVRIYGPNSKAVAKVKAQLAQMVTGTVVLEDGGTALWHDFFAADDGFSSLKSFSQPGKLLVYRDLRKQQLVLHGSEALFNDTRCAIVQLLSTHSSSHLMTLEGDLFGIALSGGFRRVVREFGRKNAKLDVLRTPPVMVFQGSPEDWATAKSLILSSSSPEPAEEKSEDGRECPFCFSDPTDPVKLDCGHVYCRDCFESTCQEAHRGKVPVACEGGCESVVSLQHLRKVLSHESFEALFEASFASYIRSHPVAIQYCPTPDCPTIYKVTQELGVFTCCNCLISTCTACGELSHEGITCEAAKHEGREAARQTEEYFKSQNIRKCPKCTARIQKGAGCNHISCPCGVHICWECMDTFTDEDDCYRHLQNKHGGYGNVDPEQLQMEELAAVNGELDPIQEQLREIMQRAEAAAVNWVNAPPAVVGW